MKVIKKGKTTWTATVICKGCHAELLIEHSDIEYRLSDEAAIAQQYEVDPQGEFTVKCPECGKKNPVKNIPPAIQDLIR